MGLLGDLILAVLSKILGHQRDRWGSPQFGQDAPRYLSLLDTSLIVLTVIGLFTGLISLPLGLFGVMVALEYASTWIGVLAYPVLMILLPFLNLLVLIWRNRRLPNPSAVAAAVGIVVSLNLPVWALPWTSSGKQPGFGLDTFVLTFCLLTFAIAAIVFIGSGLNSPKASSAAPKNRKRINPKRPKAVQRRGSIAEPDFLDPVHDRKTNTRKSSRALEQQPHS